MVVLQNIAPIDIFHNVQPIWPVSKIVLQGVHQLAKRGSYVAKVKVDILRSKIVVKKMLFYAV